jgi:hypothetical protein
MHECGQFRFPETVGFDPQRRPSRVHFCTFTADMQKAIAARLRENTASIY